MVLRACELYHFQRFNTWVLVFIFSVCRADCVTGSNALTKQTREVNTFVAEMGDKTQRLLCAGGGQAI